MGSTIDRQYRRGFLLQQYILSKHTEDRMFFQQMILTHNSTEPDSRVHRAGGRSLSVRREQRGVDVRSLLALHLAEEHVVGQRRHRLH